MAKQPPKTDLPVEEAIPELRSLLQAEQRGILVAEPGAGKSTLAPLRLLDSPWLADQRILVLEPRRVAARSVAGRMAELLDVKVGDVVGYRTRDDSKVSAATRIEVVTEGILNRRLQTDPELSGIGLVIFDEFHERSIHADMGLAFTLDVADTIRDDLRILVMSATIDASKVADLLGRNRPAPIVDCPGRTYPVDVRWRPRKKRQRIEDATVAAVDMALKEEGDVLVFLPGVGEIRRVVDSLSRSRPDIVALPLYGALDASAQDEALRYNPMSRRVIVATDVAETSLTVEGVGVVIDAGVARRPRFDPTTGLNKLVTVEHSQASAEQRSGRAGRLGPGVAFRLWSKSEHAARRRHEQPEIVHIDLASVMLEAAAWGATSLADIKLLDLPSEKAQREASAVLSMLGALDESGRVTPTGREMLHLPLPPRLAAMVAASGDGPMGWTACLLAALLSERDVIGGRPVERPADLWTRVELVESSSKHFPGADNRAIRTVRSRAKNIARRVGAKQRSVHPSDLGRTLSLAYPDRIAQNRGGKGGRFRVRTGLGAQVSQTDPLALEPMIVIAELSGEKRNPQIRRAAGIDHIDVELGFHTEITERRFFGWDDSRNDISQRVERRLGSLDFGTVDEPVTSSTETVGALIEQLRVKKLSLLNWTKKARTFQARVGFVNANCAEEGIVDLSDEALVRDAERVFSPWLTSAVGRKDLEQLNLVQIFESELGWDAAQLLSRLAPVSYKLPSGRDVPIDYSTSSPQVSVRVQELFGVSESPALAGGRVALTFELLSPARRPVQKTADLEGFWSGSWVDVRKDMLGRYPKHDWPEHP